MHLIDEINEIITNVFMKIVKEQTDFGMKIVDRGQPHMPMQLPKNKRAVYIFIYKNQFLKIGKVGVNSNARFQSQHYIPNSAVSTLVKSILSDEDMKRNKLNEYNISSWIKNNCRRIDILIDSTSSIFKMDLVEAILHYKYEPKYEGFQSQRNEFRKIENINEIDKNHSTKGEKRNL